MSSYKFRVGRLACEVSGLAENEAKAHALETFQGLTPGEWVECGRNEFFWQEWGSLVMDIIEPDYHDDRWAAWADAEERRWMS